MANKDLFKQAIAEAKSVREAAIANAKEALEETLTPHLKDMLAAKLQEMEEKSDEVEEVVNEVEEDIEEAKDDKKDEAVDEQLTEIEPVGEADEDEAEDDSEESEDEAEAEIEDDGEEIAGDEDAIEGDEDLKDLSVNQFKDMIRDIIAQEVGGDAAADDMDAGDIEGMGDEEGMEEPAMEPEMGAEEDEIDLDELIRELESVTEGDKEDEMKEGKKDDDTMEEGDKKEEMDEDTSVQVNHESDGSDYNINRVADLKEALDTIETLKKELNEVNILNAKLLYVNKIFKAQNLSESQKVNVIAAFDKAETVKEVKLVFETVVDNVGTKKETTIKEHKGSASKATGTTAKKPEVISEVSNAVLRMQKLAGIIK
jgi:hypothetical protein